MLPEWTVYDNRIYTTVRDMLALFNASQHSPATQPQPRLKSPSRRHKSTAGSSDDYWLPPDWSITIAGREIKDGMMYVGHGLPPVNGILYNDSFVVITRTSTEPALIDPALDVSHISDYDGTDMGYWPCYHRISPECRAAYLDWLEDGRRDPHAYIGYVFLFFYGIERRLLENIGGSDVSDDEYRILLEEVRRLRTIYADRSGSFDGYSSRFIEFVQIMYGRHIFPVSVSAYWNGGNELPILLRYELSRRIAAEKPISSEWALAWYRNAPGLGRLRTPARRCPDEFRQLFALRYAERFGEGLHTKAKAVPFTVTYRPASSSWSDTLSFTGPDLPNIERLSKPLRLIGEVVDDCQNELDAYSRHIGNKKNSPTSLETLCYLPSALIQHAKVDKLVQLRKWLAETVHGKRPTTLATSELFERFDILLADQARLTGKAGSALASLLEKCGYGIEPDIRFGGARLSNDDWVALFCLPDGAESAPSSAYAAAAILVLLFWYVASADGSVGPEEQKFLNAFVQDGFELTDGERARLSAYVRWIAKTKPDMKGLRKRLQGLDFEQRSLISEFLIDIAWAEGGVSADEVRVLSRIYDMLGLPAEQLHTKIHLAGTARRVSVEPVVTAEEPAGTPPPPRTTSLVDMRAVHRKIAETKRIEVVLAHIFEDDDDMVPERRPEISPENCIEGLSPECSSLLLSLQEIDSMERDDFDVLAERYNLLPEGALDALNELALDICDELLCEGEDTIEVNHAVLKEMLR